MAKRTKHSDAEIAAKLAKASELQRQGKARSEIARALGISIMTLHRWRKMSASQGSASSDVVTADNKVGDLSALEFENSRLRQLVTDLLLQKIDLEEALKRRKQQR